MIFLRNSADSGMSQRSAYRVIFYRNGLDIETLHWAGSFEETQALARKIALKGGAVFRIFKLGMGAQVSLGGPHYGLAEDGEETV
jgi:hypothetical protein